MPPVTLPPKPSPRPVTGDVTTRPTTTPAGTPQPAPAPGGSAMDGAQWRSFADAGARPEARVAGFRTPLMNASGLVDFEWEKPGDSIPFELTAEVNGDARAVRAEVWTNANQNADPARYAALPMKLVKQEGKQVTWRIDVPIEKLGNYRAAARLSVDGGQQWQWAGSQGIPDI